MPSTTSLTPEIDTNITLKRVVEKAKHQQVPSDIINRAIEKAKGGNGDDYQELSYVEYNLALAAPVF